MWARSYVGGCILVIPLIIASCENQDLSIQEVLCNNKVDPIGVDPGTIRFAWKLRSDGRDVLQVAYRLMVTVTDSGSFEKRGLVWDTGKTAGNRSILVPYDGPELGSGKSFSWRVKVWDNHGNESGWSDTGTFITGLETAEDWSGAQWIGLDETGSFQRIVPGVHLPAFRKEWKDRETCTHALPVLRKEFETAKKVKRALVFVSGLGQYELHLNGRKVSDHFLSPGWTQYEKNCLYNTYDVTDLVSEDGNCLGVMLGNGFYAVPNSRYRKLITCYGRPKMILLLKLTYFNGECEEITSNESWSAVPGPVTFSSIYGGEDYNANLEQVGWDQPGFEMSAWKQAAVMDPPNADLQAETTYPIRIEKVLDPESITRTGKGNTYLYDFGQNASGIMEIRVKGNQGDTVRLVPAELIKADSSADQRGSGSPVYCQYILKGAGTETWRPRFFYTGFRYVEVEGASPYDEGSPQTRILGMKMLHTRNSAPSSGRFKTSDEMFNEIYSLILWSIRSNMQSVLTDCPHREKLGWLEQSYLMGGSIHFNYDGYHLYCKIIDDMIRSQLEDGLVPSIAPEYTQFKGAFRDSPEWGSACVILPWLVYRWYGDTARVEKAWGMMTRYIDYLSGRSEGNLLWYGLGDWNDVGPARPGVSQNTSVALTASAIYYYDLVLMHRMGLLLGRRDRAEMYRCQAEAVREAFNDEFFNPANATYSTGSQTAMSMPLELGIAEEGMENFILSNLVDSIRAVGNAVSSGDVGNYFLIRALQHGGLNQMIAHMNESDQVPGYGFQLKKGATALTESWSALPTLSNNHLMLGHLMEWFYNGLAGIGQTSSSVAYKDLLIAPHPVGNIQSAGAEFESPYGLVRSAWEVTSRGIELEVQIPVNTHAKILLPMDENDTYREAGWLRRKRSAGNEIVVGSGNYRFDITKRE